MLRALAGSLALTLISTAALAQTGVSKVAITAAPWLSIPVGPRAQAMGASAAATSEDPTALYWNPAGIARPTRSAATFAHTGWIGGLSHDFAGVTVYAGPRLGTIGLHLISLRSPEMAVRTEGAQEGTGEFFSTGFYGVGVSYARSLTDRFSVGLTGKYLHEQIWNSGSGGAALDLGTLFVTDVAGGLRIGAAILNFGPRMKIDGRDLRVTVDPDPQTSGVDNVGARIETDTWQLPLTFRFGLASTPYRTDTQRLTVAVDALHPTDNNESLNLGGEYALYDRVFLRGGYRSLFLADTEEGLTLGLGLSQPVAGRLVRADYAYQDLGRFPAVHSLSVGFTF